ncbi:MAG: serine hydrolase [Anaerolineae bacterium]|nr:serine hydrolase [Anaerolineae bacterium]
MPHLNDTSSEQAINVLSAAANETIEQVIKPHLNETFPALTLAVVKNGEVLLNAAWGWLDPEDQTLPIMPDTLFDLASVSKIFATTTFLTLVSADKVALDDPLENVIPEFAESGPRAIDGGQDPDTKAMLPTPDELRDQTVDPREVTFHHLLTHTSGQSPWRDVFNAAGPAPVPPDQPDPISRAERWAKALHALCNYPFVGQPGEGVVRYSDLGLMLVGEAASRLHGTPGDLEAAVQARLCEPLALARITYNPLQHGYTRQHVAPAEDDPTWRRRRIWGEVHDENASGLGGVAGHAGVFGTARDVAALGQAWLDRDPRLGIDPDLMALTTREHAQTDGIRRGLGWQMKTQEGSWAGDLAHPDTYGHTGFTGTSLCIDPSRQLVIAILTNRVYPGREKPGIYPFRRALHAALMAITDEL